MSRTRTNGEAGAGVRGRAFTLIEMLVVVTIISIMLVIALPAFNSMLYSQEETAASTQTQAGLSAARDAAIQGGSGEDAAAVFEFEPGGRMNIIVCTRVGQVRDVTNSGQFILRDVFVPHPTIKPVQLPPSWMVRGYALGNAIDGDWYEAGSGTKRYDAGVAAWVFPETGFYNHSVNDDGQDRQTFIVRFEAGTGVLASGSMQDVLVLSPRASSLNRLGSGNTSWWDVSKANDLRQWAVRVLNDQTLRSSPSQMQALIGAKSSDMILARPVTQLAVYDESRLASALGVRVDELTGTLYSATPKDWDDGRALKPAYIPVPAVGGAKSTQVMINRWLEGYSSYGSGTARAQSPPARVYGIGRYSGAMQAVPQFETAQQVADQQ